ncbi:UNVERIFIED_CONTAM: hypothetical protein RMT77_006590 [Armadillidium vulgare]
MDEQLILQAFGNILPSPRIVVTQGILLSAMYFSLKPMDIINPPNAKVLQYQYDFIIVGAGSAGAVIANRLSENKKFKTLLLEAGGNENSITETPALAPLLHGTEKDWALQNEFVPGICLGVINKRCQFPRGRVLGGSSTINLMLYVRGNKRDYDGWAAEGNYGWSYEEVLPYFKKSEDNKNLQYARNERYHSTNGEQTVTDLPFTTPLTNVFLKGAQELGYRIGDYNADNQTAFHIPQLTMRNGTRCSTSKAFLHPTIGRKNLDIAKFSKVTKILIDPETNRAFGVRYYRYGKYHEVFAKKEIILTASALFTPQLLMLSGIGPKNHLKRFNIPLIKDLPVGFNLQDHYALPLVFLTDKPITFIPSRFNNILHNMSYDIYKTGYLSSPIGIGGQGFISTKYQDPKLNYPDIQLVLLSSSPATDGGGGRKYLSLSDELFNTIYAPIQEKESFHIFLLLCHVKSRGRVSLKSGDPFEKPLIKMNYFESPDDVRRLIDAGRFALKLVEETQAFKEINAKYHYVPIPTCPNAIPRSDEYFECYMKYYTTVDHHQSGTTKMAPLSDPTGVVDPELRVRGISGLRVADTSIMPLITTGNTNAPAIMIGEKASDLIKNSYRD